MNPDRENHNSDAPAIHIDLLCDRFETVWKAGLAPDIAIYLKEVSNSLRPLALEELLIVELELRREQGELPTINEYLQRFPEHATGIAGVFNSANWHALEPIETHGYGRHAPQPMELASGERLCRTWSQFDANFPSVNDGRGEVFGDFRILRELGRGGMGIVYEAEQFSMGRRVALKVLPFAALVQEKALQRFRNEVRAAAALDHPHIVSIYSVGEEHGVHFFTMQLIRGQTMAAAIAQLRNSAQAQSRGTPSIINPGLGFGPQADKPASKNSLITTAIHSRSSATKRQEPAGISTHGGSHPAAEFYRRAARLGVQAAEALQHAHDLGVLHRDIKPGNLMLDREGQLFITDFGLARIEADAGVTMTGDIIGTLRYMAPEQALAKRAVIDHRADIYSLGATLYELVTLHPAFGETDRSQLLNQITFDDPIPLRKLEHHVPVELETIVLKAMAKRPADRYQTAQQLADDLQAFLEHRPIHARPPSVADRIRKWSQRHQMVVRTAGIAFLLLSVVLAVGTVLVIRAHMRAVAALTETANLLYESDMILAYQTYEKGWSDEVQTILDRHRPKGQQPDRRGLEWHLLNKFVQQPASFAMAGHQGMVNEMAVFPDQRRLASVGQDGTLRIWDVRARKLLQTVVVCDQELHSVAISPDGRYVACGNQALYVCDLEQANRVTERFQSQANIESLAFSADGKYLVAGARYQEVFLLSLEGQVVERIPCASRLESLEYLAGSPLLLVPNRRPHGDGQRGIVQLWGKELGQVEQVLDSSQYDRPGAISIARSSPCGKFVAAGELRNSRALIFKLASGRVVGRTPVSRDMLTALAYSPDGKAIAAGYRNGRIEYFDLQFDPKGNPSIIRRPWIAYAHPSEVKSLKFVGAKTLASCGSGGLRIWTLPGKPVSGFDLTDAIMSGSQMSPDGTRLLYTYADKYLIADMDSGEVICRHQGANANYYAPTWSPLGDKAAVCCDSSASVSILDRSGQILCSISPVTSPAGVAFSPDGSLIAIVGAQQMQLCSTDDGRQVFRQSLNQPGTKVAFSHDGTRLVYGEQSGALITFDVAHRKVLREIASASYPNCVVFSPDDSLLACGHGDSVVRLWDMQSGKLRTELIGHRREAIDLAFSPDGHTLLSSAGDGFIRVWSVDLGRGYGFIYRHFKLGSNAARCSFSLSTDGLRLAVAYATNEKDFPDVLLWQLDPDDSHSLN